MYSGLSGSLMRVMEPTSLETLTIRAAEERRSSGIKLFVTAMMPKRLVSKVFRSASTVDWVGGPSQTVRRDQRKVIKHPVLGEIAIECQMLHIPDRDQRLVIYTAAPGSPAQEKLCQLRACARNGLTNLPAGS
jgi:hypothetical protein